MSYFIFVLEIRLSFYALLKFNNSELVSVNPLRP
jgi:hypothetical protein